MKTALISLVTLFSSSAALAESPKPVLTLSEYSGYTPPEYAFSNICKIFPNRVEIVKSYAGTVGLKYTKSIKLTGNINTLIQKSLAEAPVQHPAPCDIPSASLVANQVSNDSVLLTTGGCSQPRITREGGATFALKNIVNELCTPELGLLKFGE